MYAVTAAQMREIDRRTIEDHKIPAAVLMENAGRRAFEILQREIPNLKEKKVVVLAGRGSNGGDARVVARCLQSAAKDVRVVSFPEDSINLLKERIQGSDIIVDGLLGTGISRDVAGVWKTVIDAVNAANKWVLALDVPSGLSPDTGAPMGAAIRADVTVMMGLAKWGLLLPEAFPYVGKLHVVDIGLRVGLSETSQLKYHWITEADIRPYFSPRSKTSHKGSFGHLLLMGGSASKPGAILLAGRAALRAGAGLATVALPESAFEKISKGFLELMYKPMRSTREGTFSSKGFAELGKILKNKKAVAVGPGLDVTQDTHKLVLRLLRKKDFPLVLDADALNALTWGSLAVLQTRADVILTPHPGEMARLVKEDISVVQEKRAEIARRFSEKYGVILILKGFRTVIATPDGHLYINSTGNPGMATAGMGDVLTGIIGSFLAQGLTPLAAALAGVFIHGLAGDRVAERLGDRGLLASDVIDEVPLVLKKILKERVT